MFPFRFFSLLSRISQQYLEIKLNFQELDNKDFLSMFRPSPTKQLQTNSRRVSSIKFAQPPTTLSKRKHRQTSSKYQSVPEMHYPWQRKQKTPSEKSDGSIVDKSRAMFTECKMSPRAKMLLTLPVRAYLPNINPPMNIELVCINYFLGVFCDASGSDCYIESSQDLNVVLS